MSPDTYIPHRVEKLYCSSGKGLATSGVCGGTDITYGSKLVDV